MKVFSYYLPQFHPDEMNDLFWGKGFTDWTTTSRAKPLFDGHKQPYIPEAFGYYDLSCPSILRKQAQLATSNGINGFAFYNYIFDEKTNALETPINNLRNNPDINIDYFLCWVNADWTKAWIGDDYTFLYKQSYNEETLIKVAKNACWHFADSRYFKINGKPLFYVHNPMKLEIIRFKKTFLNVSSSMGFPDVLFASPYSHTNIHQRSEIDYLFGYPPGDYPFISFKIHFLYRKLVESCFNKNNYFNRYFNKYSKFSFPKYVKYYSKFIHRLSSNDKYIPTILSGWDNTARYEYRGFLFDKFDERSFYNFAKNIIHTAKVYDKKFFMIKAWNEWAEGNILEPSQLHKNRILESFFNAISLER